MCWFIFVPGKRISGWLSCMNGRRLVLTVPGRCMAEFPVGTSINPPAIGRGEFLLEYWWPSVPLRLDILRLKKGRKKISLISGKKWKTKSTLKNWIKTENSDYRNCRNKRPGRLIFRSQKNSKTHQKPSVLCTAPFEKHPSQPHRFCVLPPLKSHCCWWVLIPKWALISANTGFVQRSVPEVRRGRSHGEQRVQIGVVFARSTTGEAEFGQDSENGPR